MHRLRGRSKANVEVVPGDIGAGSPVGLGAAAAAIHRHLRGGVASPDEHQASGLAYRDQRRKQLSCRGRSAASRRKTEPRRDEVAATPRPRGEYSEGGRRRDVATATATTQRFRGHAPPRDRRDDAAARVRTSRASRAARYLPFEQTDAIVLAATTPVGSRADVAVVDDEHVDDEVVGELTAGDRVRVRAERAAPGRILSERRRGCHVDIPPRRLAADAAARTSDKTADAGPRARRQTSQHAKKRGDEGFHVQTARARPRRRADAPAAGLGRRRGAFGRLGRARALRRGVARRGLGRGLVSKPVLPTTWMVRGHVDIPRTRGRDLGRNLAPRRPGYSKGPQRRRRAPRRYSPGVPREGS